MREVQKLQPIQDPQLHIVSLDSEWYSGVLTKKDLQMNEYI